MINIILTDFIKNWQFYNVLVSYHRQFPTKFIYNFNFAYIEGNFPFSFWHGANNTCTNKKTYLLSEMQGMALNRSFPICFDFSNLYLQESDFEDTYLNAVLRTFANKGNYIKINDLKFIEIIENKYESYFFVTADIVQDIAEQADQCRFNEVFMNYNKDKTNKIVTIDHPCYNCIITSPMRYLDCLHGEQKLQYNFSEKYLLNNCGQRLNQTNLPDLLKQYLQLGFQNFKITNTNPEILISFLIKPEWQFEFVNTCIEKIGGYPQR